MSFSTFIDGESVEYDECKHCGHQCYGTGPKSDCGGIGCCLGDGEPCQDDEEPDILDRKWESEQDFYERIVISS